MEQNIIRLKDSKSVFVSIAALIIFFVVESLFSGSNYRSFIWYVPMVIGWISVIISYLNHEHFTFKVISLAIALALTLMSILFAFPVIQSLLAFIGILLSIIGISVLRGSQSKSSGIKTLGLCLLVSGGFIIGYGLSRILYFILWA